MAKRDATASMTLSRRAVTSAALAPPRLMRASVWRLEIPALPERVAFGKAGSLNQPCSGDLYLAVLGRIGRNALLFNAQLLRHKIKLRYGHDRVLEEAARTAAIRIARHQQHSLLRPDTAHRVAHLGQRRRRHIAGGEVLSNVRVDKIGRSILAQTVLDTAYYIAFPFACVLKMLRR